MSTELSRLSFNGNHVTQVKYNGVVVGNYSLVTITITASGSRFSVVCNAPVSIDVSNSDTISYAGMIWHGVTIPANTTWGVSAQNLQAGVAHIALTSDQEYVSSRGGSYSYWKRYIGEVTIPASGSVTAQVDLRIPQSHTFIAKGTYNIAVTTIAKEGTDDDFERNTTYTLTVTGDSASAAALQSLYLVYSNGNQAVRDGTRITGLPYTITRAEILCSGEGTNDYFLLLTAIQYKAMCDSDAYFCEWNNYDYLVYLYGWDFGYLTVGETKTQTINCNQTVTEEILQGVYFEKVQQSGGFI